MFTGIIEHLGTVPRLEVNASGGKLTVRAPSLAPNIAVSASVAVTVAA
jgi:riboflavin synthase alpha subunit